MKKRGKYLPRTRKVLVKSARKSGSRIKIRKSRIAIDRRSALISRHEPLIGRIVSKRLAGGRGNNELRNELMQVGRVALWNASKSYKPKKARESTFYFKHVNYAVGRALKRQNVMTVGEREVRRRAKAGIELPKGVSLKAAMHVPASNGHAGIEAKLRVRKLLSLLPKRDAQMVAASATMSQGQLGKRFKMSKTRVNQILQRARTRMRAAEAA